MSLLSRLFSKPTPKALESIVHKDCRIFAQPVAASGGHRIAARIEKDIAGQTKTHLMQRADTCTSLQEATDLSIAKARQAIDQLGDTLFAQNP